MEGAMQVFLMLWISIYGYGTGGGPSLTPMPSMAVCQKIQEEIRNPKGWVYLTKTSNKTYKLKEQSGQPPMLGMKCIEVKE